MARLPWFGVLHRDEDGQAMAEMALAIVPMLLMLFAAIQFALAYHARDVAQTAAVEGARVLAREDGDVADAEARARQVLESGLGGGADGFRVTASEAGDRVAVRVAGRYPVVIPFWPRRDITLDMTARMRKERFDPGP